MAKKTVCARALVSVHFLPSLFKTTTREDHITRFLDENVNTTVNYQHCYSEVIFVVTFLSELAEDKWICLSYDSWGTVN